jgi:hypothetical protein
MATAAAFVGHGEQPQGLRARALLPVAYALTLFASATLLFFVQPMFARMVLPLLGGTPGVWNTCMVFYQAALLAGYAYAHALTTWLPRRHQALVHACVLLCPLLVLPITVARGWVPAGDTIPGPWLLALLTVSVGLPFLVVSTSAPLLQKWFAGSGHAAARDPYFLYAASNAGSMLALLGYPFLVEPHLGLRAQSAAWAVGYGVLASLILVCAWLLVRAPEEPAAAGPAAADVPGAAIPWTRRGYWVALALVPSSLMLGVTSRLTTDVAPIPLLWLPPLALYLLTFILAFSRLQPVLRPWAVRLAPMTTLALVALLVFGFRPPLAVDVGLHLAGFFVLALVCHGELARTRPDPEYLTQYYLLMSLGGVLGGLCNALLAPVVFRSVLEFPLALVAGCLLTPCLAAGGRRGNLAGDTLAALGAAALTALILGLDGLVDLTALANRLGGGFAILVLVAQVALPMVVCYALAGRPVRFALAVAAVLAVGQVHQDWKNHVEHRERSFFGQLTVQPDPTGQFRWLLHGTTLHGQQSLDPGRQGEPFSYFHRTGPAGQLFAVLDARQRPLNVGVTGLGIGTLAAYARPGDAWTFYEIDPAVPRLARESGYFTYLRDAEGRGAVVRVVLGDARLRLEEAPDHGYDVLVLDAFSSDSLPVHLLTREAIELYLRKLREDGVLLFHISNRYLRLESMMACQARAADLVGYWQHDADVSGHPGKEPSTYVVLARGSTPLEPLLANGRWRPLPQEPGVGPWRDDFSNLLSVLRWRR